MTTQVSIVQKLNNANEGSWLQLGALWESLQDLDKAMFCFENALRHNPYNIKALTQVASICRMKEMYPKAVEYFQRSLNIESNNGEIWGALGHCYLMMEDLQKAYTSYQQALYHLSNPKQDPNLWYGIGILYDRYGSFEHAEEAFNAVLKMDPQFEKKNEIYFRLGIIYKQQLKYDKSLECFRMIIQQPPRPLVQGDIWFQIGHVHELKKDFAHAKEAYERVLKDNPNHAKVLQQLGWLYHHLGSDVSALVPGLGSTTPHTLLTTHPGSESNGHESRDSNEPKESTTLRNEDGTVMTAQQQQEIAISYLMRSIDADATDGQTWYLLGRCYMSQHRYKKAYDAYQQAVYRDSRNPTFWCSIGVLYYQINQYRDALDAYMRAIRLNPYLSEVWYDLGTLYESCNQLNDSLDAYSRASELDPNNKHIQQRLQILRAALYNNVPLSEASKSAAVHPGPLQGPGPAQLKLGGSGSLAPAGPALTSNELSLSNPANGANNERKEGENETNRLAPLNLPHDDEEKKRPSEHSASEEKKSEVRASEPSAALTPVNVSPTPTTPVAITPAASEGAPVKSEVSESAVPSDQGPAKSDVVMDESAPVTESGAEQSAGDVTMGEKSAATTVPIPAEEEEREDEDDEDDDDWQIEPEDEAQHKKRRGRRQRNSPKEEDDDEGAEGMEIDEQEMSDRSKRRRRDLKSKSRDDSSELSSESGKKSGKK
jgi:tetratricopeptide (TPR) repeat protein